MIEALKAKQAQATTEKQKKELLADMELLRKAIHQIHNEITEELDTIALQKMAQGSHMRIENQSIEYEEVTQEEVPFGDEMGLTSNEIVKFDVTWNNELSSELYFDLLTAEFAFRPTSQTKEDELLYEIGELVVSSYNRYKNPKDFMNNIDSLIDNGSFDVIES